MSGDLKALAGELLDWMRRQDPGAQAELYLARSEERGVEMREGRLDNMQHGSAEGAGLRVSLVLPAQQTTMEMSI